MGVDVVRCNCTGLFQIVHCGEDLGEHGCAPDEDCETVEHLQLSPSDVVQRTGTDFLPNPLNPNNPPLFMLLSLIAEWQEPTAVASAVGYLYTVRTAPPRYYLHFIQVLLI